jgi:hypothetical protein
LWLVHVLDGRVSAGLETLAALPKLDHLYIRPPAGGQDLSFLADCPALTGVNLIGCTELSDLSTLTLASRLRYVHLYDAERLRDLNALTELSDLTSFSIERAPLTGGLAAVAPVLDQLNELRVWSVPTVTSLDSLVGRTLEHFLLDDCPVAGLEPLGTQQSLTEVWLQCIPNLNLAPLASLPHLRKLTLVDIKDAVDLSPLAQTDHRLRVQLRDTPTVGDPGPLVKVRRL